MGWQIEQLNDRRTAGELGLCGVRGWMWSKYTLLISRLLRREYDEPPQSVLDRARVTLRARGSTRGSTRAEGDFVALQRTKDP